MIVLDCCAAVDIVRGTPQGVALEKLMLVEETVISTTLLYAEMGSAFGKYVKAGILGRKQAVSYVDMALNLVDEFHGMSENHQEALSEAIRLDHSPYDLYYFTLARRYGATLFTSDRKLARLCEQEGVDCIHDADLLR